MKTKSILMFILLVFFAMSIQSYAQMGGNPQDRVKKTLDDLKTRLKLTDAQFTKVDSILTSQMNETLKVRAEANGDFSAMREKMAPIREKTDKGIEALLTDEQKPEYKKILEERAERMKSMMRN